MVRRWRANCRSRASWCRRPRASSARSACWSPICGTIWCAPISPRTPAGGKEPPGEARSGTRRVYFEAGAGGEWAECPVWRREVLLAGNEIAGPAIVEEVSATTVLYPGDHARVDEIGSLIVEVGAPL